MESIAMDRAAEAQARIGALVEERTQRYAKVAAALVTEADERRAATEVRSRIARMANLAIPVLEVATPLVLLPLPLSQPNAMLPRATSSSPPNVHVDRHGSVTVTPRRELNLAEVHAARNAIDARRAAAAVDIEVAKARVAREQDACRRRADLASNVAQERIRARRAAVEEGQRQLERSRAVADIYDNARYDFS